MIRPEGNGQAVYAFAQDVIAFAEDKGWLVYCVRYVKGMREAKSAVGFPDLVMCRGGRVVNAWLRATRPERGGTGRKMLKRTERLWRDELMLRAGKDRQVVVWSAADWPDIQVTLT